MRSKKNCCFDNIKFIYCYCQLKIKSIKKEVIIKQIIDYGDLEGRDKRIQAIKDCKFYLGKHFGTAIKELVAVKDELTLKQVRLCLSLVGIEGYPAEAIYETYIRRS